MTRSYIERQYFPGTSGKEMTLSEVIGSAEFFPSSEECAVLG